MLVFLIGVLVSFVYAAFTGMFLIFRRDVDGIDVSDIDLTPRPETPLPERVPPAHEPPPA